MYFWMRLLGYLLTSWFRKPLKPPFDVSCLHYQAWPTDIDASIHMNNSRYSILADMGRFDLIFRMGFGRLIMKEGYIPVMMFASTRYRREIRNFDKFKVESKILSWDETCLYIEHKFTLTSGKYAGQVSALMIAKAGLYSRKKKAFITIQELLDKAQLDDKAPPLPEAVRNLIETDAAFQKVTSNSIEQHEKLSA